MPDCKVAIVSGAAQGMGEEVVRALANEGYTVIAIDVQDEKLQKVSSELNRIGLRVVAFHADVCDSSRIETIIDYIDRKYGRIDVLVNNAGVLSVGEVTSVSDEEWARTFAVNTTGVFHLSRSVCKRMKARSEGAVVTISSNAASVPRTSMAAYCSSKAASLMFTKCLGLEMAQHNIRCNIVSPGATDTEMQAAFWGGSGAIETGIIVVLEDYRVGIPLKKIASTSEVAEAILFLISDRASHITMNNIVVDGPFANPWLLRSLLFEVGLTLGHSVIYFLHTCPIS
ncbi:2,3-dihydro-2,3-dihydroxybenzoate dehydrogenase [Cytobacillus purgationiresistens]|uniref:2,3-dihydro-2,3-dihydroxybenzoate dehydrogenase n=1 Tax=Cytobacillus purgationiresistens TaxID=863449 RepID=A0ABU0ABK8_9BACI|nr:2,3-dihydro-2,3-dihydroxybenzoate dehydrogenase [Cytobacillus purgationiresistens]MDQ0268264.1 2,3-dihydro-2,3-dihydroxybenzoate dehydrogenase [Cytobacillus purgationiresistens]